VGQAAVRRRPQSEGIERRSGLGGGQVGLQRPRQVRWRRLAPMLVQSERSFFDEFRRIRAGEPVSPEAFARVALALPAATCNVQWGDDRVYKVGGKMFAVTDLAASRLSLKVSEIAYEALTESGRAKAAPYLARAKWVYFDDLAALDEAEVADWLRTAHALVAAKLTRAARRELGLA